MTPEKGKAGRGEGIMTGNVTSPLSGFHTRLTQTLISERRCGRKEMIGWRCRVRQIPSIKLLAASHSTCLLENRAAPHRDDRKTRELKTKGL